MSLTNGQVDVFDLLDGSEVEVGGTDVAYTPTYICKKNVSYAFEYKIESGGTIDCKIEIEQGNTPPATESAADGNMVVPEDAADFDTSITTDAVRVKAYAPAATRFLRAKITGQGSNAATTKLTRFNVSTIVNL